MRQAALEFFGQMMDNPIINKELRSRMRGSRAYWLLLGFLLVLSIAMLVSYSAWRAMWSGHALSGNTDGRVFFTYLINTQAILICLIAPAITAGAVSIEREQRTFDLVRCTTLRPAAIVMGKLISSVSFVVLLLTCSIPLISICFLLGGVAPDEVIAAYGMLICDSILFGAIGIAWSTFTPNTSASTALTYGTVFIYFVCTYFFALAIGMRGVSTFGLSGLNPLGAVACASMTERYFGFTVHAWLPALVLDALLTAVVCLLSINRLSDFPQRQALPVRIFAFLYAGSVVFLLDGALVHQGGVGGCLAACVGLMALIVVAPILATGDLSTDEVALGQRRVIDLNPFRAFQYASLKSSVPITLMFAAMIILETAAALHYSPAKPTIGFGYIGYPSLPPPPTSLGLLFLAVGVAIAGVGTLISTLTPNRMGNITLVYLIFCVVGLAPLFTYGMLSSSEVSDVAAPKALNWIYTSAPAALGDLCFPRDGSAYRVLLFADRYPAWEVTSVLYILVGVVALVFAKTVARRKFRAVVPG